MSEEIRIEARDGLSLEGLVDAPEDPKAAFVLCHPHPKMGGTMRAPLLDAVVAEVVARRWAVVRFNFRGIGSSEGAAGTGDEEVNDALGAVDETRRTFRGIPVAIGGWSFGAAVALHIASEIDDLLACVAIAPAIDAKPGITRGAPEAGDYGSPAPTLLVVGANDDLVDPARCREWADAAGARLHEMPAANHFFWARYGSLAEIVADFLEESYVEVSS